MSVYKLYPHLSEKSSNLASEGQYVFLVSQDAGKDEIRNDVEELYNVEVESVRTVSLPNKQRNFRRVKGEVSRLKKAIVTLRKGSIPIFEGV